MAARPRDRARIDIDCAVAAVKLASVARLAQGLMVQTVCYFGLFLSLAVAARALSPADFGVYVSAVAVASFAGSVMTAGLDRIVLRVLIQREGGLRDQLDPALFVPFVAVNVMALTTVAAAVATGWGGWPLLFIAAMATLVAARLILSGWFKFVANNHANVIATFGVQPLGLALIFGVLLLSDAGREAARDIRLWVIATLVVEMLQIAVLYGIAHMGGFRIDRDTRPQMVRGAIPHARAGLLISLLCLFAQTGPFGIAIAQWLLPPVDQGIYTVAVRVSQLILFPAIGASQLIIPLSSRTHAPDAVGTAQREIRNLLLSANALLWVSTLGFALLGPFLLNVIMNVTDPRAYLCILVLTAGNLVVGLFGFGDQIMIAVGRHRHGFWISAWCGGVLFPVLVATSFSLGYGIVGISCATAMAIGLRAIIAYFCARRTIEMPIAVFDRVQRL